MSRIVGEIKMNIAKGLITTDEKLTEETYMRWVERFGDTVRMLRKDGRYEVEVDAYIVEEK